MRSKPKRVGKQCADEAYDQSPSIQYDNAPIRCSNLTDSISENKLNRVTVMVKFSPLKQQTGVRHLPAADRPVCRFGGAMVTFTPPTQLTGVRVSAAAGQLVCWLGGQWCNGYFLAYHATDAGSSPG